MTFNVARVPKFDNLDRHKNLQKQVSIEQARQVSRQNSDYRTSVSSRDHSLDKHRDMEHGHTGHRQSGDWGPGGHQGSLRGLR